MPPTFTGLHLHVRDIAASPAFYRFLGFDVPEDPHFAVFQFAEGAQVALGSYPLTRAYNQRWREPAPGGAMPLQFNLASRKAVDHLYATLVAAGHPGELAPFDAWWGTRYGARSRRQRRRLPQPAGRIDARRDASAVVGGLPQLERRRID